VTQEASDLLEDCDALGTLREMSMRSLKSAMDSEEYKSGLAKTKDYRDSLEEGYLEDEEFSRALAACQRALKDAREAEGAAERRRALMIKLSVAGAAVTAVVLLIAAGLWIRSSMQASALADAVEQQNWDEVLAIDSQHVPALIGRAKQRLNAETPNIEGAFADIGLAEQVDSTAAELKPAKALAHVKRATSLATSGEIGDAEKDLKEALGLGASDSALMPVRQLLAAAYLKQAEEGVTSGDVAGIRAACDAAERYQAAGPDVSRLRAAAFKADGEQKAKSGDLSGAVAAFDEAVKLNSNLELKTERAVVHVKLGEQAVAKQDYAAAATELDSAVSLDKSATGVVALAGSVAEPVILAFEQAPTVENQTAALAALTSIQPVDAQNEELPELRKRVTAAVLKRGESAAVNTPDSALKAYETALSLGASASESASLKGHLVKALTARCRQSLGSEDAEKASADYAVVAKLDSQAASLLVAEFEKLPANVLTQLPANVLLQIPPQKNSIGMQFKLLPGGTFTMGEGKETPHPVTLTKPFELGVYEVTQEQFEQVMGSKPSKFKGPQNPVEQVDWNEAVAFCRKLSELPSEKSGGYGYRLPTEAEWEYACRAGTTTAYGFGDDASRLGDYGWFDGNSDSKTHPVGEKKPNAWGLYDMHGNVYEWCRDWFGGYPSGSATDPTGATSGSYRVRRGGGWDRNAGDCRSAYRSGFTPEARSSYLGFRVLRSSIK